MSIHVETRTEVVALVVTPPAPMEPFEVLVQRQGEQFVLEMCGWTEAGRRALRVQTTEIDDALREAVEWAGRVVTCQQERQAAEDALRPNREALIEWESERST